MPFLCAYTDDNIDGGSGGVTLDEELEISADDLKALIEKHAKSTLQSFQVRVECRFRQAEISMTVIHRHHRLRCSRKSKRRKE